MLKQRPDRAENAGVPPPSVTRACPRCAASARADAPWCTQCFLDLRTPVAGAVRAADAVRIPAAPPAAAWPCPTCGAANALASDLCAGCARPFLGELRGTDLALLDLPGARGLAALTRAQRFGVAFGFVVVLLLFLTGLGLLVS